MNAAFSQPSARVATANTRSARPPDHQPFRMSLAVAICAASVLSLAPAIAHHDDDVPMPRGSQSLDVYRDGEALHLLTARYEDGSSAPQLLYQRSSDGGGTWSSAVRVDAGRSPAKTARRGSDPQIAGAGDNLLAIWTVAGTGYGDSGPLATAVSKDGGKTWQAGPNPADDNSTGGHGYVDVAADGRGAFHLVWLDDRDGKQALRYTRSDDAGNNWDANKTLDQQTCECCWNTLLTASDNRVWALYRDKNPRDMALAVSNDSGESWQRAAHVGSFGWQFPNCPEAGGGLAISTPASGGETLHAIVRTGKKGSAGIHYQRSSDEGRYWSSPRSLQPGVADHPTVAGDRSGNLIAAWDNLEGKDLVIEASISNDNGVTWTRPRRLSAPGTDASHPRAVATSAGLRVFWTYASRGQPQNWTTQTVDAAGLTAQN